VKKLLILLLFFVQNIKFGYAQSSKLTLKANQVSTFYDEIIKATLIIPITDAKDPEEKALLDALKKYWTVCPYKTISRKTFDELQAKNEAASPKTFYLVKETYERLKRRKKDWAYTKYYISKQNHWVEEQDEPFIEFKLPLKTVNRIPAELSVGYLFGLMIKHFNSEVLLMKNEEAYFNTFSRKKLFKVNFKHSLKPYANKTLLVSKNELENYMINLPDDKKDVEIQLTRFVRSISKKAKIKPVNIKMVNETDIKTAISKADANTLIYTGYTIYNTQDAAMLRRIDPNRGAKPFHWVLAITIVITVVAVATVATGIL
jgi:hypothetical protein